MRTCPTRVRLEVAYSGEGCRAALERDDSIVAGRFDIAKAGVPSMQVCYVQEADLLRQALIDIYAGMFLVAPYNDFKTH